MTNEGLLFNYTNSLAIVIGINKYPCLSPLSGAVNDARAFSDILKSEFKFPSDQVYLLLDEGASRNSIMEMLELVSQKAKKDDRFIFFFAGHGATRGTSEDKNIGYIATTDSKHDQWHTFLLIDDITRYSYLIGAKHLLYIFDACFSGLALKRSPVVEPPPTDPRRWIKDCMTHRSRQVLTAGLAEQQVGDLTDDGHSIFTSHLLRALTGESSGSEGEITAARVMTYVADEVMKHPQSEQTPAYGDLEGSEPGGDMVFKHPDLHNFSVSANKEGGINTDIYLNSGDKISIIATGVISYDSYNHYTNPGGMISTYKGQPMAHPEALKPIVWPHPLAYQTNGDQSGVIGSLIGWVGEYSVTSAFLIGEELELDIDEDGYLYLSVNDARGSYKDNKGEFEVTIRVIR